jgi:hypothetical protein
MTFGSVTVIVYHHRYVHEAFAQVRIVPVTMDNVGDALSMESPDRIAEFQSFLERGDLGYYAYQNDRVVHRAWVRHGPVVMPAHLGYGRLKIAAEDAYVHYCETSSDARGGGIYPAVLHHIVMDLKGRSAREVIIATSAENLASGRGIEKAGFVETERHEIRIVAGLGFTARIQARSDTRV